MNLNTIAEVKRPKSFDEIEWRDGHALLAGGTWLFSEPQVAVDTLIDLEQLGWAPLTVTPAGLDIAATCRIVELHDFKGPPEWRAVPLFRQCIDSFLMSFKIWNAATIGGNVCMSLPAGAMISLTAALEGVCTLWPRNGEPREVPVVDFVTGNHQNVLQKGELLRKIHLPASALCRSATRHAAGVADQIRTLGRPYHRHGRRRRRGFPADRLGGHAAAGAVCASPHAHRLKNCAMPSTPDCRRMPISTTCTARLRTSATSRTILPNRYARSSHDPFPREWPSLRGRADARPVLAHLPARSRCVRRQEGLRRR